MKTDFYVEFASEKILEKDLVDKARELWKSEGKLIKDLSSLEIYYKPEEYKCYYVFNGTISGCFNA